MSSRNLVLDINDLINRLNQGKCLGEAITISIEPCRDVNIWIRYLHETKNIEYLETILDLVIDYYFIKLNKIIFEEHLKIEVRCNLEVLNITNEVLNILNRFAEKISNLFIDFAFYRSFEFNIFNSNLSLSSLISFSHIDVKEFTVLIKSSKLVINNLEVKERLRLIKEIHVHNKLEITDCEFLFQNDINNRLTFYVPFYDLLLSTNSFQLCGSDTKVNLILKRLKDSICDLDIFNVVLSNPTQKEIRLNISISGKVETFNIYGTTLDNLNFLVKCITCELNGVRVKELGNRFNFNTFNSFLSYNLERLFLLDCSFELYNTDEVIYHLTSIASLYILEVYNCSLKRIPLIHKSCKLSRLVLRGNNINYTNVLSSVADSYKTLNYCSLILDRDVEDDFTWAKGFILASKYNGLFCCIKSPVLENSIFSIFNKADKDDYNSVKIQEELLRPVKDWKTIYNSLLHSQNVVFEYLSHYTFSYIRTIFFTLLFYKTIERFIEDLAIVKGAKGLILLEGHSNSIWYKSEDFCLMEGLYHVNDSYIYTFPLLASIRAADIFYNLFIDMKVLLIVCPSTADRHILLVPRSACRSYKEAMDWINRGNIDNLISES